MKTIGNIRLDIIDLDEIPDEIDISIDLPPKKATEAVKTAPNPKNTIALF